MAHNINRPVSTKTEVQVAAGLYAKNFFIRCINVQVDKHTAGQPVGILSSGVDRHFLAVAKGCINSFIRDCLCGTVSITFINK
ncbi:unnamed protein product [Hymenolepis diminuta]|uniref:Uncharacterized protein n=1 Tax=Hymenolepis diminuta TaxID=6216 RepID=A0A564XUM2_HYMDI|nr:unnamed protein product [Hymenolepis diminuta]